MLGLGLAACGSGSTGSNTVGNGALIPACRVAAGRPLEPASSARVQRNVRYGSYRGRPLLLDVYSPAGAAVRPAVLVMHSGGWTSGDKSAYAIESEGLAKSGIVAFDADYTLAGPGRPGWPLQFQELQGAVRWIRAHAASYRVDPTRIGAFGGSAGGTLAEMLGTDGECEKGAGVVAVVSWSGPTDLGQFDAASQKCLHATPSPCATGSGLLAESRYYIGAYLGCLHSSCASRYAAASPITRATRGTAPTLLFNSDNEAVPLAPARAYISLLDDLGVPATLVVYHSALHAEEYAALAGQQTLAFLARYLTGR